MDTITILAMAGSSRRLSLNQGILRSAMRGAELAGAKVEHIDLRALELPIFDEDWEAEHGAPAGATRLKAAMQAAAGFLVASPEYNASITPLLKNAVDWASRRAPGEPPTVAFKGKVAAFMSASAGAFGGVRALPAVRFLFENLGTTALPTLLAMPKTNEASFGEDGFLTDEAARKRLEDHGAELVRVVRALKA
jgi:NAD(P)H-dependent FMN reductase